jgi:(S)-3,5-dihydroxyphenylglycine transaminase
MRGFHLGGGGKRRIRLSCSALEHAEIVEGAARLAGFVNALERTAGAQAKGKQ